MILPEQRESFVNAYRAAGGVLSVACAMAGIDERTGKRMLLDGKVNLMIAARRREAAAGASVTAERVLERLSHIAFGDVRELAMVVRDEEGEASIITSDARDYSDSAVALYAGLGPRGEIKVHNQMDALRMLASYVGIVPDAGRTAPGGPLTEIVRRVIMPPGSVTESLDSGVPAADNAACDPNTAPTKP